MSTSSVPDIISLSEDFFDGEKIAIDVNVKVLSHENENDIIGQYIIFCKIYDEQRKLHGATKEAITEAIRICKDRNVLKGYLESREQEVVSMVMSLFDDEYILKAYAMDIAREEIEKVTKEADIRIATNFIKKGKLSLEDIAECVPSLSMEELKELQAEVFEPVS